MRRVLQRTYAPRADRLVEGHGLGFQPELPGDLHGRRAAVQQRPVQIEEMKSRHVRRG
jgi:hypothetical protein